MANAIQTTANLPFDLTPDLCHPAEKNRTMYTPIVCLLSNYVVDLGNPPIGIPGTPNKGKSNNAATRMREAIVQQTFALSGLILALPIHDCQAKKLRRSFTCMHGSGG
jgi:hypothetical protein